jgi:AcrR family transcriptional regulator
MSTNKASTLSKAKVAAKRSPHGGDEVRCALIEAAASLFAERGFRGVSVRQIGTKAGVHYTLINRHFGSRQALLKAAFDHIARDLDSTVMEKHADEEAIADAIADLADHPRLWRMMVHGLLEQDISAFASPDRVAFRKMVNGLRGMQARNEIDPDLDTEVVALMGLSAALGWLLLEKQHDQLPLGGTEDAVERRHRACLLWWKLLRPKARRPETRQGCRNDGNPYEVPSRRASFAKPGTQR